MGHKKLTPQVESGIEVIFETIIQNRGDVEDFGVPDDGDPWADAVAAMDWIADKVNLTKKRRESGKAVPE